MTKRIFFILFYVLCFLPGHAETDDLRHLLEQLEGVSDVERLESTHNQEKYLVRVRQLVNPRDSSVGTFMQRVIVAHAGFDRPTVLVTEGYGAAYALDPRYQEELSELLDANMVFVEQRYFLESTPEPCNWDYLTAENSAYDLHHVNQTFRKLYPQHRLLMRDHRHVPHRLCLIRHVRGCHRVRPRPHVLYPEIAVNICNRAHRGSLNHDRGADQWLF